MSVRVTLAASVLAAAAAMLAWPGGIAHGQSRVFAIAAPGADLRSWNGLVESMIRSKDLELRLEREDTLMPGRTHERYTQSFEGIPVYGGDIARQRDDNGLTISIFGTIYEGIAIDTAPALSADAAQTIVEKDAGVHLGPTHAPRLVILPRENQTYALAYQTRAATARDISLYFIDARTGAILVKRSDAHTQQAVGIGHGVLGDAKKVMAKASGGVFVASDLLRPPVIETYDVKGNTPKVLDFLNGYIDLSPSDLATDTDNDWTDGADVDAHTYAGYTYDYYYKRFGRRGLDNANIRIRSVTHPVNRQDFATASDSTFGLFYINAFYAGDGIMVYGEGLPPSVVLLPRRTSWNFLAGALDVVGHELSHGVTDYTSQLIYSGESGALNESFSDIMGTSIEFFFQQPGSGPDRADYLIGEDVVTPGGIRSMSDPASYGDPDHYTQRYTGADDNGGVHTNSSIPNQAFYLAIEGGTNRTSGLSVQGVGAANREQIEKVFYRAFTQLLPSGATFSIARAATIQAARDLYGNNSAAERAVSQAWSAVGVE